MSTNPVRCIPDPRAMTRRTLWISTIEGSFTQVFFSATTGSVLTGFILYLGAGPVALALAASLPQLAQLFNPLTAWGAPRIRNRRRYIAAASAVGRVLWLGLFFLPLFMDPGPAALLVAIGLVAVSGVFQNSAGLVWVSLMADIVPEEIRGRYFGMRSAVLGVVGMSAGLAAGWYLDRAPAPGGFQMVFLVALVSALIGIWLFQWYGEKPSPLSRAPTMSSLVEPLRDPNFRRFLTFSLYWQGAVMIAAPFVIPYFLTELRMTYLQVATWTAIASICSLVTSPMWGRIGDMAGHRTVLMITTVLAGTVHPLCWMLATPGHLFFIWVSGVMDALSWGGVNPAMFNLTITTAPGRARLAYLAVLNLATGLIGFTVGMLSGPLTAFLSRHTFEVAGYRWTGFHTLFVITGLLRSCAWILLRRVHEPESWGAWRLLRVMGERGYGWLMRPFARDAT